MSCLVRKFKSNLPKQCNHTFAKSRWLRSIPNVCGCKQRDVNRAARRTGRSLNAKSSCESCFGKSVCVFPLTILESWLPIGIAFASVKSFVTIRLRTQVPTQP